MVELSMLPFNIRPVTKADLDAINKVIEAAIMSWNLPERVKHLSLSSYRYTSLDFDHLDIVVAEDANNNIIGVAAWEVADPKDTPLSQSAILLHGIYVTPTHHRKGIGHQLFLIAEQTVRKGKFQGLLVKAQKNADGFFLSQGMKRLPVEDAEYHYANRFWKKEKNSE